MEPSASPTPAQAILEAWRDLETALRNLLPACSLAPPNQPGELLAALRVLGILGPEEEVEVQELRRERNQVAHSPQEPSLQHVHRYRQRVEALLDRFLTVPRPPVGTSDQTCR